jgi:ribonucleoside-diphosphate reductase beta chain
MALLDARQAYLPIEYPDIMKLYQKGLKSFWSCSEVIMDGDVSDWELKLTDEDKNIISGVLRGFTLTETLVGDYWSHVVSCKFRKPEIISLARVYAAQEACHAEAYNHLAATLGINDHEAFLADPAAQEKLGYLVSLPYDSSSAKDIAISLAIFSGFVEGVALFSSFAILTSFGKRGLLLGVIQLLGWSIDDEDNHYAPL